MLDSIPCDVTLADTVCRIAHEESQHDNFNEAERLVAGYSLSDIHSNVLIRQNRQRLLPRWERRSPIVYDIYAADTIA